jgi:hypothetical protein
MKYQAEVRVTIQVMRSLAGVKGIRRENKHLVVVKGTRLGKKCLEEERDTPLHSS